MYATVDQMIARFGEAQVIRLSCHENRDAETVDVARVETALTDATAVINDYIRGRYQVPIASPPESIVRAACILARYDLADGEHMSPTEEMRNQRKDIIAWLEQIAREMVSLDAPLALSEGAAVGSGPRMSDRPRIFTDDTLRGM